MDILLVPITDITKHIINKKYLTYEDNMLNMMLYGLLGTVLALICRYILQFDKMNIYNYIKWHIDYKILNKKVTIFHPYYSNKYEPSKWESIEEIPKTNFIRRGLFKSEDVTIFLTVYCKILKEYMLELNPNEGSRLYRDVFTFNKDNKEKPITTISKALDNLFYIHNKISVVAYINGYFIYLDCRNIKDSLVLFYCKKKEPVDIFLNILYDTYKELNKKNITDLQVFEPDVKLDVAEKSIGLVKKQLTFDNFVSRYKELIITQLDSFKNNEINKDNIFIDNNLGFLLHGTYGTGKSFLISAIANYLNRSIFNINFAKIKTKSKFREIMSIENIDKYVFCFDEFDYLLTSIIDKDDDKVNFDHQFKLNMLSKQLIGLKDNKEASEKVSEQIKKLMEEGISDDLTYEFILSELSGITSVQNRIIVATTNFLDKIPKALLRPGRFDVVLQLDKFNKDEIIELLIKLYNPSEKIIKKLDSIKFKEYTFTPSDIIFNKHYHTNIYSMIKYLSE